MNLIVDTNVIIASLIRNNMTRNIIRSNKFVFYTPIDSIKETLNLKDTICKKANLTQPEFEKAILDLLLYVDIITDNIIEPFIKKADEVMKNIDITDSVFIACALATKCDGIYSNDKHFEKQNIVKVWKTEDLMKYIE